MIVAEHKRCSACHRLLPVESFSKARANKDGLFGRCKECVAAYKKAYLAANSGKVRASNARYREENRERVRTAQSKWKAKARLMPKSGVELLRECERVKLWRKRNPERAKQLSRAKYERNKDVIREKRRSARISDPEPERARARKYHRAHPEAAKAAAARRTARALQAPGHHTAKQLRELFESYRGLCAYCGDPAEHADHVIPLSGGGSNDISNIVPACKACNLGKHSTPMLVWLSRRTSN